MLFDRFLVIVKVVNVLTFVSHIFGKIIVNISIDLGHNHGEFAGESISVVADGVLQIWVCTRTFDTHDIPQRLALTEVLVRGPDSDPVRVGSAWAQSENASGVDWGLNKPGRSTIVRSQRIPDEGAPTATCLTSGHSKNSS